MNLEEFIAKYDDKMNFSEKYFLKNILVKVIGEKNLEYVVPQKEFIDSEQKCRRIDFAIETLSNKYAIEVDGYTYHAGPKVTPKKHSDDIKRQNDIINAGYKVLRFTWDLIKNSPQKCVEQLKQAFANDEFCGTFCRYCGERISDFKEKCSYCGTEIDSNFGIPAKEWGEYLKEKEGKRHAGMEMWNGRIKKLQIYKYRLKEMPKGIENLRELEELCLNENYIRKIENLENLENLKILWLPYNSIEKIEGLENLTKLEELRLEGNKIRKIENLENLRNLKVLLLFENEISKIEGLDNLWDLEVLYIGDYVSKIEGLEELENLKDLMIGYEVNRMNDIREQVSALTLKKLWLGYNKIRKIEGLEGLYHLELLELKGNKINKIEGLYELVRLEELYLGNNNISKIEGLSELSNLKYLDLSNNNIRKIEGLDELINLETLDLSNNNIRKIEGLENLDKLKTLHIGYNKIEKNDPEIKKLRDKGVHVSFSKDSNTDLIKELDSFEKSLLDSLQIIETNLENCLKQNMLDREKALKVQNLLVKCQEFSKEISAGNFSEEFFSKMYEFKEEIESLRLF